MMKKKIVLYSLLIFTLSACKSAEDIAAELLQGTREAKSATETVVVLSYTPTAEPTLTPTPVTPTPIPSQTPTVTPIPPPTHTAIPIEPKGRINQEEIMVYAGPGEDYDELDYLSINNPVTLIGISEDGLWAVISYWRLDEGWIPLAYVDTDYDTEKLAIRDTPANAASVLNYTITVINTAGEKASSLEVTITNLDTNKIFFQQGDESVSFYLPQGTYKLEYTWVHNPPYGDTKTTRERKTTTFDLNKNMTFYIP